MTTFTHAGVSKHKGEFKVRFANDALRTKVLQKNDHTDIDIVELKYAMTKQEAVEYLIAANFAQDNAEIQAALEAALEKRAPKSASKEQKPNKETKKAPKPKAPKVSLEDMEEAAY